MDLKSQLFGGHSDHDNKAVSILFTDDGPEGYFSKEQFIKELLKRKGTASVRHIQMMFDHMSLGRDLRELPEITSLDGEDGMWIKFHYGKVKQNLRIVCIGRMYDLVMDYANGKLKEVKPFDAILDMLSTEE